MRNLLKTFVLSGAVVVGSLLSSCVSSGYAVVGPPAPVVVGPPPPAVIVRPRPYYYGPRYYRPAPRPYYGPRGGYGYGRGHGRWH